MRTAFLALIAFLIAGCGSAPDPVLAALHASPPRADMARLVILYPAPFMGSNGMAQIKWNDAQSCDLRSGSYSVRDIAAGNEVLVFSFCGMPGVSTLHLKALAGETYYIRIRPYDSSLRGILSGYPGEFTSAGVPMQKGPFAIERLDEPQATDELHSLTPSGSGQ